MLLQLLSYCSVDELKHSLKRFGNILFKCNMSKDEYEVSFRIVDSGNVQT